MGKQLYCASVGSLLIRISRSRSTGALLQTVAVDARRDNTSHSTAAVGIAFKDLHTTQSSLENIFVGLVKDGPWQ